MTDTIKGALIGAIIPTVGSLVIFFLGNFSTQATIEKNTVETLSHYFDSVDKDMSYKQALQAIYKENEKLKNSNQNDTNTSSENAYKEEILEQADALYQSGEIESAIDILSEGLETLPGYKELSEKISEYRSDAPIALFEKQILYHSDCTMLFSHREDYKHSDNVGNMYPPDAYEIYANSDGKERSVTFMLDKQYTLLTGTLAIRKNGNHESIWLEFYDGDILLGKTDVLEDGVRPITFEINIAGVTDLTIKSKTNTSFGFAYTNGFYIQ